MNKIVTRANRLIFISWSRKDCFKRIVLILHTVRRADRPFKKIHPQRENYTLSGRRKTLQEHGDHGFSLKKNLLLNLFEYSLIEEIVMKMTWFGRVASLKVYIINGKKEESFRYWLLKILKNSLYFACPKILLKIIKTIKITTTSSPKFIITMKLWDANPKYLIIDSKNIL